MSSRRKNTKPQAIREVPEQLPRTIDTALTQPPASIKMKETVNSVSSIAEQAVTNTTNSPIIRADNCDLVMPTLSIERGESDGDCPLKIDTQFSNKLESDDEPDVSIGSDASLNETGDFDDGEDMNDPKRKCREETKIHPYERRGNMELFRCPLCQVDGIESRKNLTNHLRLHQNKEKRDDGKHLCCLCSHELSSNSSLERHLLTHTNFRPFTCKYCSKSFTTNGNLSRHIKTTHSTSSPLNSSSTTVEHNHQSETTPLQSQKVVRKMKSPKKSTNTQIALPSTVTEKEDLFESNGIMGKDFQKSDPDILTNASTSIPATIGGGAPMPVTSLSGQHSFYSNMATSGAPSPFPHYLGNKALTSQLAASMFLHSAAALPSSQQRGKYPFYCMGAPHPSINPLFPSLFMPGATMDPLMRLPNDYGVVLPPPMAFLPMQQTQQTQKVMEFDSRNSTSSLTSSPSVGGKLSPTKKQRERKQRKSSAAALPTPQKCKKAKFESLNISGDIPLVSNSTKGNESGLDLSVTSSPQLLLLNKNSLHLVPTLLPLPIEEPSSARHLERVSQLSKVIYRRLYKRIRHTVFFSCPICKKTCQKNFNMMAHRALLHPQNGVHNCPSCDFNSQQPRIIFDHIRQHCRVSRRFKSSRITKKNDNGRKLYRCWYFTSCTKSFATWAAVKDHMTASHSEDGNPFDFIKKEQQKLLLTPEHSDEESGGIHPVFNSTPLDFSLSKLKQRLGKDLEEQVRSLRHKTEPLSIEPMSSSDDGCEGALDLSFRSSTQSLHLSGYSSMETDHTRDQSDYHNNNKMDAVSPWNNLKLPCLPPPVSHAMIYNQQSDCSSTDGKPTTQSAGQFAMRRPKKNSNLSMPHINPDYLQSAGTVDNSFWSASCKSSNSFSTIAAECLPNSLAGQPYLPFHSQNGPAVSLESQINKSKKSHISSLSEDSNGDMKLSNGDDDENQMKKLMKKKNSYKDAPKLITCPVPGCLQKFPWHSSLKRHIITHTEHKPYKCTRCHKSFSTKSNRERHMERLHGVSVKKAKRFQMKNNSSYSKLEEAFSDSEVNHCPSISSNDSDSGLHQSHQNIATRFLSDSELKEEEILSMDNNDRQAETISTNLLMQAGEPQIEPNPERFSATPVSRVAPHCPPLSSKRTVYSTSQKSSLSPESSIYFHRNWSPTTPAYHSFETVSTDLPNCFQRFEPPSSIDLSSTTFKCPFCALNFPNRMKTLEHFSHEHTSEWSMLQKKMNARDIQDVIRRHHSTPQYSDPVGEVDSTNNVTAPARNVQCCVCLHKFQSYQDLQRHIRSHTGARPYLCPVCGKEFSLKHSMQRHLKAHSEESVDVMMM